MLNSSHYPNNIHRIHTWVHENCKIAEITTRRTSCLLKYYWIGKTKANVLFVIQFIPSIFVYNNTNGLLILKV